MERIPEPELMDDPAVLWETVSDRHVLIWGNV